MEIEDRDPQQEAEHERLMREEQEYRKRLAIEKRAKWFYEHNYDDTAESEQCRDD